MQKASQTPNNNCKLVILVSDEDCAAVIMYHLGIRPEGIYKNDDNVFYASFKYDPAVANALDEYFDGTLVINALGFLDFYAEAMAEWGYVQTSFGQTYEDEPLDD